VLAGEEEEEEEEEFFNHSKNDLERHAHAPSGVADLTSQEGGALRKDSNPLTAQPPNDVHDTPTQPCHDLPRVNIPPALSIAPLARCHWKIVGLEHYPWLFAEQVSVCLRAAAGLPPLRRPH